MTTRLLVILSLLAAVACDGDSTPPVAEEAPEEPANELGFHVHLDSERSDPGEFRVFDHAGNIRIQTGPAGIAFRPEDRVDRGDFRVEVQFDQIGAPVRYREAYGIFVGGRDLEGPEREYTYLLVRASGDFLVKRRVGDHTEVMVDWTPSDAVAQVTTSVAEPRNTLAVDVRDGVTRFEVNGVTVHEMPTAETRPYGIAGIRINHRLDVRLVSWRLETRGPDTP